MLKKILIDAFYPEEIKFLLLNSDGAIEEFDYQSSNNTSIKGNIYLGKVNRIEPSLQAAFIEYGKEKKGFLSFGEIHPQYYQIPVEDKEKLIEEFKKSTDGGEESESNAGGFLKNAELYNSYKIQEVIKKDQILLVQVEKEERGNKGAFLSTYISLFGRYCVFSPKSMKSGCGISRRLDDQEERERLKNLASDLLEGYPDANLILRTACAYRTKVEIKRDFSYLNKSWENIKNATISSYAPALIHEEGDLIISGIKDFYTSDVEKIIVSGSEAYKKTKEFLKVFAPKNIDKLEEYNKAIPILHEYKVESQLQELYSSKVNLKSGGHLVIAPTEALVAIDVNSGTYTEKYSIEDTALNINLEAAAEIAKQIRFRGLSGLIVIDFIDMMDLQNKKHVEKVLKKAFWKDSVKVQLGKISEFGLLEMSRQRIGRSFMESNSAPCRRCSGIGKVIMTKSVVLLLMGKLKSVLTEGAGKYINIFASTDVILSLINSYKAELGRLEKDYKKHINLYIDDFIAPQEYRVISEKFEQSGIKNQRYAAPEIAIETDEVEEMPSSSPPQAAYKGAKRNKNKEFAPKTIFRKYNANTPRKNNNQKRFSNNAQPQPKKDAKEHTNLLKKIWKNITD